MRLLYVIDEHPSLTETFVIREIDALARLGHHVIVQPLHVGHSAGLSIEHSSRVEVLEPPSVWDWMRALLRHPLRSARAGGRGWMEWRMRGLTRMLFAHVVATGADRHVPKRDSAHVHAHFAGRCADVAWLIGRYRGTVYSVTGHASDLFNPESDRSLRRRLNGAEQIVVVSEAARQMVQAMSSTMAKKTHLIRCGVPLADFVELQDRSSGARTTTTGIVTVARLTEKKGLGVAIDAASILRDRRFSFDWVIVGDGELHDSLSNRLEQQCLTSSVHLVGALRNKEALRRIADADLFVLPCVPAHDGDVDGVPVALMESMALGTPVVTTPVGGIAELVRDQINGHLAEPGSPEDLAGAIVRAVAASPPALTREARATIKTEYDIDQNATRLASVFARAKP